MAEQIPPAVIRVTGDDKDFVTTVGQVKALLADLAKQLTKTKLGADAGQFKTEYGTVEGLLKGFAKQVTKTRLGADGEGVRQELSITDGLLKAWGKSEIKKKIGIDLTGFYGSLNASKRSLELFARHIYESKVRVDITNLGATEAKLRALGAMKLHPEVDPKINMAATLAKLKLLGKEAGMVASAAELRVLGESAAMGAAIRAGGGRGGGGGGAWGAAAAAASGGNGGSSRNGGILGAILGSSVATAITKAFTPSFGRLGRVGGALGLGMSLAGLSVEHLAVGALDMSMTAAGALGGFLIKGLAAGGVAGVGMGTDLSGLGQAAGDIKTINTDTNNLNKAVAIYGKNSSQAQAAQKQLNYDLSSFSKVARGPVKAAVAQIQKFVTLFDKFTGPAEAKGANIIDQAVKTAESFLSIVGKFANINMGIIGKSMSTFETWLTGPGKKIFTQLEKIFTAHLPTDMSAFVNGLESMFKVIGQVAPKTGGFMKALNTFFTKLNTELSQPNSKAEKAIASLLKDEAGLIGFLKALGSAVYNLFSNGKDQHTGLAIFKDLTKFLNELAGAEKSASGAKSISSLFKASKGELLAMINLVVSVLKALGSLLIALAPSMHKGFTVVLNALTDLMNGITSLIQRASKVKGLRTVISDIGKLAGAAIGIGLVTSQVLKLANALKGSKIGSLLSRLLGKGGKGGAADMMSTAADTMLTASENMLAASRPGAVTGGGRGAAGAEGAAAGAGAGGAASGEGAAGASVIGDLAGPLAVAFSLYETRNTAAGKKLQSYFSGNALKEMITKNDVTKAVQLHQERKWKQAATLLEKSPIHLSAKQVTQFFKKLEATAKKDGHKTGTDLATGLANGIKDGQKHVAKVSTDLGAATVKNTRKATGSNSPSVLAHKIGMDFDLGLAQGMQKNVVRIVREEKVMGDRMLAELKSYRPQFHSQGEALATDVAAGFRAGIPQIVAAVQAGMSQAAGAAASGSGAVRNSVVQQLRGGRAW